MKILCSFLSEWGEKSVSARCGDPLLDRNVNLSGSETNAGSSTSGGSLLVLLNTGETGVTLRLKSIAGATLYDETVPGGEGMSVPCSSASAFDLINTSSAVGSVRITVF